MSIRKLLAILVAVAVLFAPAFVAAGIASAAVPDHHVQMMQNGHCQMPPSSGDHQKMPAKNCCMAMCMAVALSPQAPLLEKEVQRSAVVSTVRAFRVGQPAEIATPPPRFA
jgi:hypothetical protein